MKPLWIVLLYLTLKPLKILTYAFLTFLGTLITIRLLTLLKHFLLAVFLESNTVLIVTVLSLGQFLKAFALITITLAPMVALVSFLQFLKALAPMLVTL